MSASSGGADVAEIGLASGSDAGGSDSAGTSTSSAGALLALASVGAPTSNARTVPTAGGEEQHQSRQRRRRGDSCRHVSDHRLAAMLAHVVPRTHASRRWIRLARRACSTSNSSSRASATIRPPVTTGRPPTIVSRAANGPHRSHASIGSATAPAAAGPVSDQTAMSPTAPGSSTPSSPVRPRHAAPPSVAISSDMRAVAAAAPFRNLASNIAWRASSHNEAASADDDPSTPSPTGTPAARRSTTGAIPEARIRLLDGQWATPTPAAPSRAHLVGIGHHTMRHPGAVAGPSSALEILHRAATEHRHAELVVLDVLGEVGVEPHVESLGEFGGAHHQRFRHAERRARCQRDPRHRTPRTIVMTLHGLLAGGEDRVVVAHDVVGRQPAVLLRQRHRPAGGVETDTEVAGRLDLGGQQVAGAVGMQVQMVGRGRATRQRQLGQTHPRRDVHRLGVDRRPQRIQRREPPEQRVVGHRRVRPCEVLEDVVVCVDEPRRDEAIGGVDRRRCVGCRSGTDRLDQAVGDRRPSRPPARGVRRRAWRRSGRCERARSVMPAMRRWRRCRRASSAG